MTCQPNLSDEEDHGVDPSRSCTNAYARGGGDTRQQSCFQQGQVLTDHPGGIHGIITE